MQFKGQKDAGGKKVFLFDTEGLTVVEVADAIKTSGCNVTKAAVTYRTKSGSDKTKEIPFEAISAVKTKHGFDKWSIVTHTPENQKVVVQIIDSAHAMSMKVSDPNAVKSFVTAIKPGLKKAKPAAKKPKAAPVPVVEAPVPVAQLVPEPAPVKREPAYADVYPEEQSWNESYDEAYYDDVDMGRFSSSYDPYRLQETETEPVGYSYPQRYEDEEFVEEEYIATEMEVPKPNVLLLVLAVLEALFIIPIPFAAVTFLDCYKGKKLAHHDAEAAETCFSNMKNSVIIGAVFVILAIAIFVWKMLPVLK